MRIMRDVILHERPPSRCRDVTHRKRKEPQYGRVRQMVYMTDQLGTTFHADMWRISHVRTKRRATGFSVEKHFNTGVFARFTLLREIPSHGLIFRPIQMRFRFMNFTQNLTEGNFEIKSTNSRKHANPSRLKKSTIFNHDLTKI